MFLFYSLLWQTPTSQLSVQFPILTSFHLMESKDRSMLYYVLLIVRCIFAEVSDYKYVFIAIWLYAHLWLIHFQGI